MGVWSSMSVSVFKSFLSVIALTFCSVIKKHPVYCLLEGRRHSCLSQRFWEAFPDDLDNDGSLADGLTSGGEGYSDEELDDEEVLQDVSTRSRSTSVQPASSSRQATPPALDSLSITSTGFLARTTSTITHSSLPNLWEGSWDPDVLDDVFRAVDFPGRVYELATPPYRGSPPKLIVKAGPDIRALASYFRTMVMDACHKGDFTHILTPSRYRTFSM